MTVTTCTNKFGVCKWIVNPTAGLGTHTTIAAAITAASSGDDIFITPGTYTENLTAKAGVNIIGFAGDEDIPQVTIVGKVTFTAAGSISFSNIRLQTNSDFLLAVTGSAASIVNLNACYLNCSNNTGISFTTSSSSASINCFNCEGNLGTTGIAYFASSSAGVIAFNQCNLGNTGNSTTAATISAGTILLIQSQINNAVTSSGTAACGIYNSQINLNSLNTTCLTIGGSGSTDCYNTTLSSGTAAAISIGSSATIAGGIIQSTNANPITGAGAVSHCGISFSNTGSGLNTSTPTKRKFGPAIYTDSITFDNTNVLSNFVTSTAWTPALKFGGGSTGITYSVQSGIYIRIGNAVHFKADLALTNKGSSTGTATVTGFPFTTANDSATQDFLLLGVTLSASALNTYTAADIAPAANTFTLVQVVPTTGTVAVLTDTNFANTTEIRFSGTVFL